MKFWSLQFFQAIFGHLFLIITRLLVVPCTKWNSAPLRSSELFDLRRGSYSLHALFTFCRGTLLIRLWDIGEPYPITARATPKANQNGLQLVQAGSIGGSTSSSTSLSFQLDLYRHVLPFVPPQMIELPPSLWLWHLFINHLHLTNTYQFLS